MTARGSSNDDAGSILSFDSLPHPADGVRLLATDSAPSGISNDHSQVPQAHVPPARACQQPPFPQRFLLPRNLYIDVGPLIRPESGRTPLPDTILTNEICERLPKLPAAIIVGAPATDTLANGAGTVPAPIYPMSRSAGSQMLTAIDDITHASAGNEDEE